MGQIVIVNQIGQNIDNIRMGHQIFQSVCGSVCMCVILSGRKERKKKVISNKTNGNERGWSILAHNNSWLVGWLVWVIILHILPLRSILFDPWQLRVISFVVVVVVVVVVASLQNVRSSGHGRSVHIHGSRCDSYGSRHGRESKWNDGKGGRNLKKKQSSCGGQESEPERR
jgi:hypothetical protein